MEISYTNLGTIIDTIIDYRGKTPLKLGGNWEESPDGNFRAFSAKNIKTGKIVQLDEIRFVSPQLYKKWMKIELKKGDILITSEAPFGQIFYWDSDEKIVLSQRLFAVRIKPEIYDKYAYYYMTSSAFQGEMKARSTGSTVEGLRQTALLRCNFVFPKFESQKKIANMLYKYDLFINNNHERIKILEQMAESLYKEWFVRFRFPGNEKVKFVDSVPSNFSIKKLDDLVYLFRGKGYSASDIKEGDMTLLSMNNIKPFGGFLRDFLRPYCGDYKESHVLNDGDLIMCITDMTQERRVIGYVGIVTPCDKKMVACTHLIKLVSKEYDNVFLYSLFTYSNLSRKLSMRSTGTNVLGLTADIIKKVKALIPERRLINLYVEKVKPIFNSIRDLELINENLIKQRDALLPRLMSGKLSVEGKEIV